MLRRSLPPAAAAEKEAAMYFIGIDLGTSACKLLLVDEAGAIVNEVTHEYPDLTVHLTLFNAEIASGTPQKLEHNDIRWISPEEIDGYDFCPADEVILQKIRREGPDNGKI